ncbi:S-layer homology domain-containing protein [Paenibacillus sp. PR3]|uniref:S-layer homology domain-containing protein n=1 Tax=Paenibacillus terricola TaxID=2763503 RepID=A0ABR8MZG1_9BACL|nr:S-layer homology domain-containing protein [Paenibacillus terricola]MBD3920686.1 S-layer homology domain-containing protein [Paenibacillus terricola]
MSVKGQLLKYSLAAAIVSTSFAGIPFSEKGLANHLAAQTAFAASTNNLQVAIDRFNTVSAALTPEGATKVEAARSAIKGLAQDNAKLEAIAGPIATKLGITDTNDRAVFGKLLLDVLSIPTTLNVKALDDIRTVPEYREVLKRADVGVTDVSAITVEAVATAAVQAEAYVGNQLKSKSILEWAAIAKDKNQAKELVSGALNAALSASDAAALKELVTNAKITGDDLAQALDKLEQEVNSTVFNAAALAIADAYYNVLNSSTGTTPGGSVIIPSVTVDQQFNDLIKKLEGASDAEKQELVKQALALFAQVVKDAGTIDASSLVKTVDGVAVADVSDAVIAKLDIVISAYAKLQEFLKAAGSDAKVTAGALTVNLGKIANESVEIKLSEAATKKLNASPFGKLDLAFNGLTVSVPNSDEYGKSLGLKVNTKDNAGEPAVKGYAAVSSVYDFNLAVGGQAVHEFTNPIVVRIPLGNLDGVDKELLSVAKIVDGKLVFQGGVLDGNTIVEPRESFSSYVVVENKVSFADIASVKSWAGRQIEVLAAKGAISGRSENVFDPKGNVTRAEFAKMLVRALNLESSNLTSSFKDVKSTDWFAPYVAAAAKKGIINGRTATTFAPNATITRAEMATMIARALSLTTSVEAVEDVDGALKAFKDAAQINATLKAGVALAAKEGIVIGNNGKFNPNNNASRAEAAVILYRAIQVK